MDQELVKYKNDLKISKKLKRILPEFRLKKMMMSMMMKMGFFGVN